MFLKKICHPVIDIIHRKGQEITASIRKASLGILIYTFITNMHKIWWKFIQRVRNTSIYTQPYQHMKQGLNSLRSSFLSWSALLSAYLLYFSLVILQPFLCFHYLWVWVTSWQQTNVLELQVFLTQHEWRNPNVGEKQTRRVKRYWVFNLRQTSVNTHIHTYG